MCKELLTKVKEEARDTADMLLAVAGKHGPSVDETIERYLAGEVEFEDIQRASKRKEYKQVS